MRAWENITGVTELNGDTMTYTYDALYRLIGETRTGSNAYTKSYTYDLTGNVTELDGNTFATYDDANKFATIPGGSATYNSKGELLTASGTYIPNSYYEWSDVARLTYQRNNTSGTYTTHK